ncbi:hypothetical protein FB45DRAFT_839417 [Roridomyces roridus]|uniref:Uncharacterized protein n=1 Tax=Roridomyces roridus TaxID=1738132 RepID=A0AAD7FHB8_9AGAR|nr:hypothetical protein FB45DRAFT_839417 [Roridomyces roridus]
MAGVNVPSIRLIVPTPDVSAATDTPPAHALAKKKSGLAMFTGAAPSPTPYNTARGAGMHGGDFSDIVRRVGGEGSVTGRGWEVHVDAGAEEGHLQGSLQGSWRDGGVWADDAEEGGEGMVLIRKKVKTRGRVDAVFADVTNTSSQPLAKEKDAGKDKWWNLTRGRKDTGGGVLGFVKRGKSPGPGSLPPTPTLEAPQVAFVQRDTAAKMQAHLPGEPDCTLDMVEVPSIRGRGITKDLPFPPQKRYNSLGASSALSSAPTPTPRADYQRSVSAGLLSAPSLATQQQPSTNRYANLPGASSPYATMTRAETYQPPASARQSPPKPPPGTSFPYSHPHPQRSASALGIYNDHPAAKPDPVKRSASALASSGILLATPASTLGQTATPVALSRAPTPVPGPRSGTPTTGFLSVPGAAPLKDKESGSIAVRAMRSVRSMARLWDEKPAENEQLEGEGTIRAKKKVKVKAKEETVKGKKEKEKEKKGGKEKRVPKSSGSSFEVGALGASPVQRKRSILGLGLGSARVGGGKGSTGPGGIGLGLPSALTIGRVSGGKASTASSMFAAPAPAASSSSQTMNPNRLSAESAGVNRRGSGASSLRPMSVLSSGSSTGSRVSSVSTGSVRWAEEVVDRVRGGKEKMKMRKENKEKEKEGRESRRSSDGRRRTPLSEVFPGLGSRRSSSSATSEVGPPMLTVEEATTDGHGSMDEDDEEVMQVDVAPVAATPKRPRPRPVSDDMIVGQRPRGATDGADNVLNLLDAATNDLAQLINHLDLEATPGNTPSPARAPIVPRKEWQESPTSRAKTKTLRASDGSVSSLRPYAARASPKAMLGQQIAPWPVLNDASPPRVVPTATDSTFKRMHRRTMTPTPEPEPAPVFQPLRLRPSGIRPTISIPTSMSPAPSSASDDQIAIDMRAPSSLTFGSRSSSSSVDAPVLAPVFTRHSRNRSSLLPDAAASPPRSSRGSTTGMPLARDAKRVLGMGGTMGGSDVSGYECEDLDASDPDSDIPDELQVILTASRGASPVDDTFSFRPPVNVESPGLPPDVPLPEVSPSPPILQLPIFLIDDDGATSPTEDDTTNKSFDFTGELMKLNESGGSDRLSFVEQLENAFKTPAKIDLRNLLSVDVPPPLPPIPMALKQEQDSSDSSSSGEQTSLGFSIPESVSQLVDMKDLTFAGEITRDDDVRGDHSMEIELFTESQPVHLREPTFLPGSDSFRSDGSLMVPPRPFALAGPSDGQLNVAFKFGGAQEKPKEKKPMTLADIIPPPSHVRSQSLGELLEEDESVLNSIFANAADIQGRGSVESSADESVLKSIFAHANVSADKSRASMMSLYSRSHSRPVSTASFTGLDSFDEVRRGFEFHQNRPAFYPPPAASNNRRAPHGRHESVFSIASVSSYGHVTNNGIPDPFDYGLAMPSLRERPSSEDLSISMSINVEDTFSFLGRPPRKRVESDASSFYFKAPAPSSAARGHRRRESNMSVASQGPPNSFYNYNRSFASHRLSENDTSTSGSSLAHQYAAYGANGGRAAWARHRQDSSMDSVMSDYSVARLGRPGVGDKMFQTYDEGRSFGEPLSAISASPPESHRDMMRDRSSYDYDSIMDEERRSSMEDSLFEKTGHRSSMSSDSVFGYDDHNPPNGHLLPPNQFRPLSMLSINNSMHSPMKEDDTMISMLGGGHVRRRSIGSVFEASPCVRVEKRKHALYQDEHEQPNKARIITTKPSTSSSKFGGERMIRAQQGLLVRQSLEENALVALGEDNSGLHVSPVFSRPSPNRSRSSTITTSSSGAETPPLSSAEGSSMSDGSQSSIDIDMSEVNVILSNATHPMSSVARDHVRSRARGHGHRRRFSHARASRSSVYETIQEEHPSPAPSSVTSKKSSPTACQGVFIVDHDSSSIDMTPGAPSWDDERGILVLRKYHALRHEAEETVEESKRTWSDTPFSVYALQAFQPPKDPRDMRALLQHSVQNYGPLPSELGPRRIRSRTSSRASPYPQRQTPTAASPKPTPDRPSPAELHRAFALQDVDFNAELPPLPPVPVSPKRENAWGLAPNARPRVGSAARRTALGWAKRSTKASTDQKENNTSISFMMTPGESLRLNRPRPRGRPTPARPGAPTPRQTLVAA